MSVLMIMRVKADPDRAEKFFQDNRQLSESINEEARSKGCLHHAFYATKDEVFVVDEWQSPEGFQEFFSSNQDIPKAMKEIGVTDQPRVEFMRPLDTGDAF